jgi:hypothetical protein
VGDRTAQRYAVVSCHVERLLDDAVWERYRALLRSAPGGFRLASLVRPADPAFGEDEAAWLERAREAAKLGPLGVHTHWTAPDHARPTGGDPAARVRAEGERLAELGLRPTLFCGGGWYTDGAVAEACAAFGYADCTPRPEPPPYLADGAAWAQLEAPARLRLPSGGILLGLPTSRSLGGLTRAVASPRGPAETVVHAYFHDTDLLDAKRRGALRVALRALAFRRRVTDLDTLGAACADAPERAWNEVVRGRPIGDPA